MMATRLDSHFVAWYHSGWLSTGDTLSTSYDPVFSVDSLNLLTLLMDISNVGAVSNFRISLLRHVPIVNYYGDYPRLMGQGSRLR